MLPYDLKHTEIKSCKIREFESEDFESDIGLDQTQLNLDQTQTLHYTGTLQTETLHYTDL